ETYTYTRTSYKTVCKQETYTAYRCECVPVTKTRTVTCYKRVPEMCTEYRDVCVRVPCVETRTTCKKVCRYEQVTEYKTRWRTVGHWECCEVPVRKHGHRNGCCDTCCTKTVKKWVTCKVCEQCPVTRCHKVWDSVPCTEQVCTYRTEHRKVPYQVCRYKCVPECRTETYTCTETRTVPFTCTRNVQVCVPFCETCTGTRMVVRCVARQVPCAPSCDTSCCCCPAPRH